MDIINHFLSADSFKYPASTICQKPCSVQYSSKQNKLHSRKFIGEEITSKLHKYIMLDDS